ncbi:MAG: nucleoside kinase [Clostridiales bacterium]|nr:nucleoside kinase [Clostridiales bacterium]
MKITLNGKTWTSDKPRTLGDILHNMLGEEAEQVFACFHEGDVLELSAVIEDSATLVPITYRDEEGKRIFERSLRFVLLMAAKELFPDYKLRIEHSIGQGVYIEMEGRRLTPADVSALEGMMWDLIQKDLPFVRTRWSREEAISYFISQDEMDKAKLLSYRPYDFFNIYTCGGLSEYFYGAMLPSTGMLRAFALRARAPGLVLLLPDKDNPEVASEYVSLPKHMAVFAQSNYWCKVLRCNTAAELNGLVANHNLREFIRVNEAFHSKTLTEIAEDIANRGARAVFIAGPSSSGKTTFANRLAVHLKVGGLEPVILSMDDFYKDRDKLPLEANGQPDLEAISALDVPYLRACINSLLSGQETAMPRFDFTTQRRAPESVMMKIGHNSPLIIEGIHGLNPALHEQVDSRLICRIYISQLTTINLDRHNRIRTTDARLLRRIVRDHQFRNTPPLKTLEMWDSVRRGEEKWIFPYQENADIVFNSALHYELPILKNFADVLYQVPTDSPHYIKVNRLLKIMNYLLPADPEIYDEIPPLSILREFIGGNTLYRAD